MYRIKLLLVISILALFGSCRTVSAPKGSVPNRFGITTDAFGGWMFTKVGTLSNGAFATFTLPVSLVTGILITNAESKRINYFDYPNNSWEEQKKFARFPQGLPEGIRTEDLKPRE